MRIGIAGLAGVGKNTAADFVAERLGLPCVAFATPIHEAAKYVFGTLCLERAIKELSLPFGSEGFAYISKIAQSIINECSLDISDEKIQNALKAAFTNPETGQIYEELSPRKFMQLFGTEFGRTIDEKIWVRAVEDKYQDCVISDVRFTNELGICNVIILVERNCGGIEGNHISENLATRLASCPRDVDYFTIKSVEYNVVGFCVDNNGTIDDLHENLKQKLSKIHL